MPAWHALQNSMAMPAWHTAVHAKRSLGLTSYKQDCSPRELLTPANQHDATCNHLSTIQHNPSQNQFLVHSTKDLIRDLYKGEDITHNEVLL